MRSRLASPWRGGGALLLLLLGLAGAVPAQTTPYLIAPSIDEEWDLGSDRNIRWALLPGNNAQIELTRDNGATWEVLFANVPNGGAQRWVVTGPVSLDCSIRVRSLDEPAAAAIGGRFRIVETLSPLAVTAPDGGEVWTAGTQQLITWSGPPDGDVRIELSIDGGNNYQTIFGSTPNDGEQLWTVPELFSTEARIRITHVNDPFQSDVSHTIFEIARVPGITVTTPSGGELWEIGTRREVRWEGTLGGGAKIELSRDSGASWETLFSNTPNDGAVEWQVEGPASATCRVRVTRLDEVNGEILVGESTADFGIVETVSGLTLTRPNGGEILIVGSQQLITWNAPAGGSMRIELSRDSGASWETLFGSTPNDGAQLWTVTEPVSPSCLVRVTSLSDDTSDVSDAVFYVTKTPGITVGSPNGGEVWTLGSLHTIFWNGLEGGRVMIELSRDEGGSWETLFESTPNDGAAPWLVTGPPTTLALIRVKRLSLPEVDDISDAVFEIDVSPLAVSLPKDGDEWVIGAQRLVQWSSLPVGQVQIDLSRDGGVNFAPIYATTPNDGGQFWTVEGPPVDQAVIRVTALGDAPGFGFSDGFFRIVHGTLALTAPNGGEQWAIGAPKVITWDSTTAGTVRIELSRDGGVTWETVFRNTANDGNELWTVTGPPCLDCRLRVASWQDETLLDASDGSFSIACAVATATILPGQEVNDALAAADCEVPHRPTAKGKIYTFDLPHGGLVSIDVRSAALHGYLYLTAPDGHLIAEGPDVLDSIELPPGGPYAVEMSSLNPAALGPYTIRLQLFEVTLLSPSGGAPWKLGEYQIITWNSPAPGVPADIRLVSDGIGTQNVSLATPNDGVELWRVTGAPTDHAVIRVCIPYGSRGTQICDQSSPFAIARCTASETRACYSGPPGTLGIGQCRRGTQTCGGDGVLSVCQGEVLPATDLCGDGVDQDCAGGDVPCRACAPDASCSDGDGCTTDSCQDGVCLNALPAPPALFECRAGALDQALASILTGCEGTDRLEPRARHARKLAALLVKIERLTGKATAAGTRRGCLKRVAAARRTAMKLNATLERGSARGVICAGIATMIQTRVSGLGEAIVAVGACDGKS